MRSSFPPSAVTCKTSDFFDFLVYFVVVIYLLLSFPCFFVVCFSFILGSVSS